MALRPFEDFDVSGEGVGGVAERVGRLEPVDGVSVERFVERVGGFTSPIRGVEGSQCLPGAAESGCVAIAQRDLAANPFPDRRG
nr:hypothetical protein [Saccharopolyspora gloriosae]